MLIWSILMCQQWDKVVGNRPPKNDRIGIGCIGPGGMGQGNSHAASRFGEIVAFCDVDIQHCKGVRENFLNAGLTKDCSGCYQDYRKLLDRKDVDVIIHTTANG